MPITPFHFGPALVAKSVSPSHFSLTAFAATQVIIDAESVTNILLGRYPVHDHFHTVVGASLIALLVIAVGKVPLTLFNGWLSSRLRPAFPPLTWTGLIFGAIFGGLSHIGLDSIMHADMSPLAPWRDTNPLLGVISLKTLHVGCVVLGVLAGAVFLAKRMRVVPNRESKRCD